VKVLAPAFYAAGRTRVAVLASLVAVAGNITSNLLLHPHYGYRVLALGTAFSAILNVAVLYAAFSTWIAPIPHRALAWAVAKIGVAAVVMGVCVEATNKLCEHVLGHADTTTRLIGALGPVIVGALVYAAMCLVLHVEELAQLRAKLFKRRA
jgi:putative peptidoglycan lipid II flippase